MNRLVILGRGGAGKSTLAKQLGAITGLQVIELDKIFWQPGLRAMSHEEWSTVQRKLVEEPRWIMDGDLGPYDAVEIRLRAAETIILLDFSLVRCVWQALKRSREGADFWRWVLLYRLQSRPRLMQSIARCASNVDVHVLRNPEAVRRFLAKCQETPTS